MGRNAGLAALALVCVTSQIGASGGAAPALAVLPPGAAGLPRPEAVCARAAGAGRWEPRPANRRANATVPSGPVPWSRAAETVRWRTWVRNRARVSGRYTGTTDQILRWAGCRWGIGADLLRAVALQESGWDQGAIGDGGSSFGLMQIKDHYRDGSPAWGGYPATRDATALNAEFYAAYIRSCFDGDFADGGQWLYRGRTISEVIAARGRDYALWGCVGSWYSGSWYDAGARSYIARVKQRLAARSWERLRPVVAGAGSQRSRAGSSPVG